MSEKGPLRRWLRERETFIPRKKVVDFLKGGSHSPQWIDARFESLREEYVKKWREKGYSERLIRRALAYANDYSIGMAEALGVSPEVIYPKSLAFADTWLEELTRALFV